MRSITLREILVPEPSVPVRANELYPIAGVYGFGRGLLLRDTIRGSETAYSALTPLNEGDVVYSKLKAFEGAITVVPKEGLGRFVSPEFPVFRCDPSVDSRYLKHLFAWDGFVDALKSQSNGIGARRERVHSTAFLSMSVRLPDLAQQRRIAAHLDAVEALASESATSTVAVTTGASALVEQRIAEVRAPTMSIGSVAQIDRRWLELDDGRNYFPIGVRGFDRGMIRYDETPRTELSKLRYFQLRPGRLIVSNIKAWEGAVTTTSEDDGRRIGSNRFLQYKVISDQILLNYLHRYLVSPGGIAQLRAASPGMADRNRTLSMSSFESIRIPVPDLSMQRMINEMSSKADALAHVAHQKRDLSNALTSAARNKIFSAMR